MAKFFTKLEADKIQIILNSFCGQEMVYSPNDPPSVVSNIEVQQSAYEINSNGKIDFGYYVLVHFENGKSVDPYTFSSNNNITGNFYALHSEITKAQRSALITNKSIYGRWIHKNDTNDLEVTLDGQNVTIKGKVQSEESDDTKIITENNTFQHGVHWIGDYILAFMSIGDYEISYADETHMGFSKLKTPGVHNNDYKYSLKLTRIS